MAKNPLYTPSKRKASKAKVSPWKAKEILQDGTVHGKPLTAKQRRFFGWVASGGKPKAEAGRVVYATEADSLALYNNQLLKDKFYENNPNYTLSARETYLPNEIGGYSNPQYLKDLAKKTVQIHKDVSDPRFKNKNFQNFIHKNKKTSPISYKTLSEKTGRVEGSNALYKAPDFMDSDMNPIDFYHNPKAPAVLFSPYIMPQGLRRYVGEHQDISQVPYYDPIAIKPYKELTPKEKKIRDEKYPPQKPIPIPPSEVVAKPKPKPKPKPVIKTTPQPVTTQQVADTTTPVAKPTPKPVETAPEVNPTEYYGSLEGFPMYINQQFVGVRQRDGKNVLVKPEHFKAMGLTADNPNTKGAREYILGELQKQTDKKQAGDVVSPLDPDKEWLKNWYNKRKIADPYIQEAFELDRPDYIKRMQNWPAIQTVDSVDEDPHVTGTYEPFLNKVYLQKNALPTTKLHELSHHVDYFPSNMLTLHEQMVKQELLPREQTQGVYRNKYDYFSDPGEIHSRIMVLRKLAGFKPDETITSEKLNKFLKLNPIYNDNVNDLLNMVNGEEGLLNLLNFMSLKDDKGKPAPYIDKSNIEGRGLFASRKYKKGELIGLAHENDQPANYVGKYHNHSTKPSAINVKVGDQRFLAANKPLKPGQEITTNYYMQPDLEQPEDFPQAKGGMGVIADRGRDIVMPQDGTVQFTENPDYQGFGYSNKGYNYNSAWGGRWQNGGQIPAQNINTYDNIPNPNLQLQNIQAKVKQKDQEAESFMAPIRKSVIGFTEGWLKSPMYQQMMQASIKDLEDIDFYTPYRQQNLKELKDKPLFWQRKNLNQPGAYSPNRQFSYILGQYWPDSHHIEIDKSLTPTQAKFTAIHELTHGVDRAGKEIPVADVAKMRALKEASQKEKLKGLVLSELKIGPSKKDIDFYNYLAKPTEVRARLNTIRFHGKQSGVYDPYTEKIDVKKLQQIENIRALEQLRQVYTDDQIVELLNTISKSNAKPNQGFPGDNNLTAQAGKTFLQPTSSKLPMGYAGPVTEPSTERAISIGGENGEPAYLIPTFKYGRLLTDEDAKVEFRRTGEHLGGPFKTWQEAEEFGKIRHQYVEKGQDVPSPIRTRSKYQTGGPVSSLDSLAHQAGRTMDFEYRKGSAQGTGLSNYGNPALGPKPTRQQAVDWYMQNIAPNLGHFPTAMEKGEAGDFYYNTGRDPRVYMLDQYLKSTGQASGIPNRASYNVDTKTAAWTPQLQKSLDDQWNKYKDEIYKLPVNERRILLNKGRDFYYQNINKKPDGSPSDAYYKTWKPRIWEAVNEYAMGGSLPGATGMMYARTGQDWKPKNISEAGSSTPKMEENLPEVSDAGDWNMNGDWVEDWDQITKEAIELGARKVKTPNGTKVTFDNDWNIVDVIEKNKPMIDEAEQDIDIEEPLMQEEEEDTDEYEYGGKLPLNPYIGLELPELPDYEQLIQKDLEEALVPSTPPPVTNVYSVVPPKEKPQTVEQTTTMAPIIAPVETEPVQTSAAEPVEVLPAEGNLSSRHHISRQVRRVLDATSPWDGDTYKNIVSSVANEQGVDPRFLWSSSFVEGMGRAAFHKNEASKAYVQYHKQDPSIINYKVDGFRFYGLDNFATTYPELVKKGYLPKDFDFKPFPAINELGERVQTAAFKNHKDAIRAKAAYLKHEGDGVKRYADMRGLKLSPNEFYFLTMAAYNGGPGAAQKMINHIVNLGVTPYQYIKQGQKGQVFKNVLPRYKMMYEVQDEFEAGGQVSSEQDMGQLKKLDQLLNFTNYNDGEED